MFLRRRLSDADIVKKIKEGDEKALLYLYEDNYAAVKSYVLKNNGSNDDIEDIMQDALIALWQNVNKSEFDLNAKLSTYFYAIVKNLWLKQLSKKSRMDRMEEGQGENLSEETGGLGNFDKKVIVEEVMSLGEVCKKLLMYFYFDGLDMKVIADKLNFANAQTAKAKKYQCFKKLEEQVKAKYSKSDFIE